MRMASKLVRKPLIWWGHMPNSVLPLVPWSPRDSAGAPFLKKLGKEKEGKKGKKGKEGEEGEEGEEGGEGEEGEEGEGRGEEGEELPEGVVDERDHQFHSIRGGQEAEAGSGYCTLLVQGPVGDRLKI
jgi:hypothetical protein